MPSSTNEEVKSVGNSWIICRSKSYLDRIYYFNTLTGEAVWNLSEAEMEKARKATKLLSKANNSISMENCPEPIGSPEDNQPKSKGITNKDKLCRNIPPKIFNKPNIHDQFSKSAYPSINPMQFSITVPSMYNHHNWNIPPQPVIITPIDQTDYTVSPNLSTYIPVSRTNISLSSKFKSFNEIGNTNLPAVKKQNQPTCTDDHSGTRDTIPTTEIRYNLINLQNTNKTRKIFGNKQDLREILSARRRTLESTFDGKCEHGVTNINNKKVLLDMRDEEWLVENLRSNPYSNIDTSALQQLLNEANNTGLLYIVTDTNVLINNTNFLKVLLHSDKGCNLILPRAVVDEIKRVAETNPLAQEATYFISQQVDLNHVVIDEERLLGQNIFCIQDEIIGCCSRLSEQGCAVILITNNIQTLHLKEKVTYKILTMREVKTLVCRPRTESTYYLPLNDTKRNIKITIPNESDVAPSHNDESNYYSNKGADQIISGSSNFVVGKEADLRIQPIDDQTVNVANNEEENDSALGNKNKTVHKIKLKRRMSCDNLKSLPNEAMNFKGHRRKLWPDRTLSESYATGTLSESYATKMIDTSSCHSHSSDFDETQSACNVNNSITNEINNQTKVSNDNDPSINDSKHVDSVQNLKSPTKDDKNVMFEITSQTMEDNLRVKCDEWVSRFTQVMEEVLTQVLNREPKFVCEAMPPPWSLYEATECTRKKFHNDCDIVDAANKLRNILFDIGGSRGKVKTNISPQQYMEVYSYGVYVIDALQAAINDCEDIQIAAESLSKLLNDIQDPNLDTNNQNLIANVTNEENENTTNLGDKSKTSGRNISDKKSVKVLRLKNVPHSSPVEEIQHKTANNTQVFTPVKCKAYKMKKVFGSPSTYRLRSSIKNALQNVSCDTKNQSQNVTDTESSFFDSLHLTKNNTDSIEVKSQKPSEEENMNVNEHDEVDNAHCVVESREKTDKEFHNDTNIDRDQVIEPKVIRNFVTCLEFEERIKSNKTLMNDLDTSFTQDDEFYDFDDPCAYYHDSEINEYHENDMDEAYEFGNEELHEEFEEEYEEENDMNRFIDNIIKESKEAIGLIQNFCEKSYEVLQGSSNVCDKSEILREAEEANATICNICDTLDSILKRESTYSKDSIRSVSKNPIFILVEMSEEEVQNYRRVIAKCSEQGNILKESLTLIINAIKLNTT